MRSQAGPITEISVFATEISEAECVNTQFYIPKSQKDPSGNFYYQQWVSQVISLVISLSYKYNFTVANGNNTSFLTLNWTKKLN